MFPIRDHNPSHKFPIINIIVILVTSYVFFLQITAPDFEEFILRFALIPRLVDFTDPVSLLPFIYSIFLHGGWFHVISNLWFLWIFGDNIEAHFGHIGYAFFYLATGIIAGLTQFFFVPNSAIPTVGASGAISGVLGAYLVLYPKHKIDTLIISFFGFFQQVSLPAGVMLGYWFIIQLFSGIGTIGLMGRGGVAWWAHIGGFAAGYLFVVLSEKNNRISRKEDESDFF